MAALLVGYAARRLRPTPVVGLHFLPRSLNHTHAQQSTAKPVTAWEIHQKKEELYDMISNAEKFTYENSQLIRHLSVHIYPRPGDPKWQRYRIKKWITNVVNFAGIFTLGVAAGGRALIYVEDRNKEALGVKNKLEG